MPGAPALPTEAGVPEPLPSTLDTNSSGRPRCNVHCRYAEGHLGVTVASSMGIEKRRKNPCSARRRCLALRIRPGLWQGLAGLLLLGEVDPCVARDVVWRVRGSAG